MTPEERGFYIIGAFFIFIALCLSYGASTGALTVAMRTWGQ